MANRGFDATGAVQKVHGQARLCPVGTSWPAFA